MFLQQTSLIPEAVHQATAVGEHGAQICDSREKLLHVDRAGRVAMRCQGRVARQLDRHAAFPGAHRLQHLEGLRLDLCASGKKIIIVSQNKCPNDNMF